MPIARLRALWRDIYESLWLLPALFTAAALALAWLLVHADPYLPDSLNRRSISWLFGGGADGARGVLSAIAGSIMTVTGVVFSVTIVALQLASSQYTPRVLRTFMADRSNQFVLAVFIGTFVYALAVMRTIHGSGDGYEAFVPALAVTAGFVFAIISIGCLIYYIHHAARSIQIETIMANVTADALRTVRAEYSKEAQPEFEWSPPDLPVHVIRASEPGYLTALDEKALLKAARSTSCIISVEAEFGQFVYPDMPLARLWGNAVGDEIADDVRNAFATGAARTQHQDPMLGIVELVDIAVKALSPGINDPTTAMNAFDRLGEILLEIGKRHRFTQIQAEDGATIILARPTFAAAVELAVDQIARYGATNPAVIERIASVLGRIASLMPAERHATLRAQLERVRVLALERLQLPHDRTRVNAAIDRAVEVMSG